MDTNLKQYLKGTNGAGNTLQTIFRSDDVCIPPINLSTILHAKHIEVSGKKFEPVGAWYLTGTGEKYARCGEFVRAVSCPEWVETDKKHDRWIEKYSCHRPACPECYESWAQREATTATERLLEGQKLYFQASKKFTLKHIVISPPAHEKEQIRRNIEQGHFAKVKQKVLFLAKKAGVIGGLVITHLWRQVGAKESDSDEIPPSHLKDGDWYFSPHWHFISAGYMIPSTKFFQQSGGWIYKNLGKRKSILNTIFYLLTHCSNHQNHHALSYFGIYSYNKIIIESEFVEVSEVYCSHCHTILFEYAIDFDFNQIDVLIPSWDKELHEYRKKIRKRIFKLKTSKEVIK